MFHSKRQYTKKTIYELDVNFFSVILLFSDKNVIQRKIVTKYNIILSIVLYAIMENLVKLNNKSIYTNKVLVYSSITLYYNL